MIGNHVRSVLTGQIREVDDWILRTINNGNFQNSHLPDLKVFEPIITTEKVLMDFNFNKLTDDIDTWFIHPDFLLIKILCSSKKSKFIVEYNGNRLEYFDWKNFHNIENLYRLIGRTKLKLKDTPKTDVC